METKRARNYLSLTLSAVVIVCAAWFMTRARVSPAHPEPEETTFSSEPGMDIHMFQGTVEIADGETFEAFVNPAAPRTVGQYFTDLQITFTAADSDTVIPPGPFPGCAGDEYQCRDFSHPGPPPDPSIQSWPRPTQTRFSPTINTPITEPTTITVTMTWRDDGWFGDGFFSSDGCKSCYANRLEDETKDTDVVKTVTIEVKPPCECDITLEDVSGVIDKGHSVPSIDRPTRHPKLIIKNKSTTKTCTYDWTIHDSPADPDVYADVSISPSDGSTPAIPPGGQYETSLTISPDDSSFLGGKVKVEAAVIQVGTSYESCSTEGEIEITCSDQNITDVWELDMKGLIADALDKLPMKIPIGVCNNDPSGNAQDIKFKGSLVYKDCCDGQQYRNGLVPPFDGKLDASASLTAAFCGKDLVLWGINVEESISIPLLCDEVTVRLFGGVKLNFSASVTGTLTEHRNPCKPENCLDGNISCKLDLDLTAGVEGTAQCDTSADFGIEATGTVHTGAGIRAGVVCPNHDWCLEAFWDGVTIRLTVKVLGIGVSLTPIEFLKPGKVGCPNN